MTEAMPIPVVALVSHARDVAATERGRFAATLRRDLAGRALLLETCHRVEAYLTSADDAARLEPALPVGARALTGDQAVRHAMTVAVGRDSVVIGEDQILHQIRASVDEARAAGALDPILERLFALALQAARRARSWHQGPARSLADVALASIERDAGPIRGRDVLIVGAGRMGRLAARAAVAAGASVTVANRSTDGAEALAASVGGQIEAFDPGIRIGRFAAVLVALGGPWPIRSETIETLVDNPTVLVDLSVPAAVPAAIGRGLGSRLVTADDLARADADPTGDGRTDRVDALVERTTVEFLEWLDRHEARAVADALLEHADHEREAELATLWRRLPDLQPDARDAIELMTRHLAKRLLREPLERLGRDSDGREERAVRDLFAL
jgi:glutamyl-tRNA reductase